MQAETISCSGCTKTSIEVRPVTVVFNASQRDIIYDERISITPEMTLKHFDELDSIDPYSAVLFRVVVHDYPYPITKNNTQWMAAKHLIGLFSLNFKFMIEGKKVVWKYPESFLHPKYQGNIAEVMILMADIEKFAKLIRCVQKGYFDDFLLAQENEGETVLKRLSSL